HLVEGLLIAILDIDEVIQLIRGSDDSERAKARLMEVFDLSTVQAEYILELRLRRLTKFSRMELEAEADKLRTEIASLEKLLASPSAIRAQVSTELGEAAERYATPRRTLLTAQGSQTSPSRSGKVPANLEHVDTPCLVLLSATGRIARVDQADGAGDGDEIVLTSPARRSKHDAIRSRVRTSSRSEIGVVTSTGRLIRMSPLELPVMPANSVQLAAGVKVVDYLALTDRSEQVLALVDLSSEQPLTLGTAMGVVKRVAVGSIPAKPSVEVISLKPNDRVIGADASADSDELVFVSAAAQLLRFPASAVRPQGPSAGGMAGISLASGDRAIFFGVTHPDQSTVVVSIATSAETLAGVEPGSAKVSEFSEFPAKGRATGGVRAQRFLKGESELSLAWVGPTPPRALGADGSLRELPDSLAKRDASGSALEAAIDAVGETIA
ncbi:MAG: DNA gyrase subunit A, partial [Agromyces sp.]